MNDFKIYAAPLQGYTEALWRRSHSLLFGGIDCYFTPFVRIEKGGVRTKDLKDISPGFNDGVAVVPQAIFSGVDELRMISDAVRQNGYSRLDINLGCPFPPQWRKGRGAGMITRLDEMEQVAEFVRETSDLRFSIKMRLGIEQPEEYWQLLPMLNAMPLTHITIHPRVARQQYSGGLFLDEYARILVESAHPVIFNGDIASAADIERVRDSFPRTAGVMIGRGLLARPSLADEWHSRISWPQEKLLGSLLSLHDVMYAWYCDSLCGESQILAKIRPFWDYPGAMIDRRIWKAIRKSATLSRYEAAVAMLR